MEIPGFNPSCPGSVKLLKIIDQQQTPIERQQSQIKHREPRWKKSSLVAPIKTHAANERFAKFLENHMGEIFTFLRHLGTNATNWRAEQTIRPAVVNRKVWGGNRTENGAQAQSVLMSIIRTCTPRLADHLLFLRRQLTSRTPLTLPLPSFPR